MSAPPSYDDLLRENDALRAKLAECEAQAAHGRLAEAQLRESEARYRALADTLPQIVYTATAAGLVEYVNRPGLGYMGVTLDDAMGLGWLAAIHPGDRQMSADRWLECIKTGAPYEFEHRLLRADGEYRWQLARAIPIVNDTGGIIRWIGTSTDIHDRKEAEETLRQKEEFIRRITDVAPSILYVYDLERRCSVWGNRELYEALGYGAGQLAKMSGRLLETLLHPNDWTAYQRHADALQNLADGEVAEFECRMRHADGAWRWLHTRDMVFRRADDGRVQQIVGAAMDMTEPKQAEHALRSSHAFIRHIIDTDPNFIFAKDREGRFTLVNRAVAECYGTSVEALLGKTDADFNPHAEEVAHFQRKDRQVFDDLEQLFIAEEAITDASGAKRWLQTVKRPLCDEEGQATQVLGVSTDITQRKAVEQALRKSEERLQAIMNRAPVAIFMKDRGGRHLFLNTECAAALGMPQGDAVGKTDDELFPPALALQVKANDLLVWESGQPHLLEERLPGSDGLRIFLSQKFLLRDADGRPYALCGIATEITERKRAEERQRFMAGLTERIRLTADAETLLQEVVESVGRFLGAAHCSMTENDAALRRARLRASWSRHPSTTPLPQEFALADDGPPAEELKSGRTFHCRDAQADERTALGDDPASRLVGAHGILCVPLLRNAVWVATFSVAFGEPHDWTEDKVSMLEAVAERAWHAVEHARAERALRESEERLRLALAGGQMGAWDVDLATDETRWDAKEYALLGLAEGTVTPSTAEFYRRVHPDDLPFVRRSVQRAVEESGSLEHEFRILAAEGEIRWLAAKGQVLTDERGRPTRMVGVNFDVTERKRTEEQLRSFTLELETRVAERTRELVQSHDRLRALATELNLTEQRERARLAVDLHDYLAQLLALVRIKMTQIKRLAEQPEQVAIVIETQNVVNEALTYTRTLVTQLSPPVLHNFGLPPALKWLGRQMVRQELSVEVRQLVPDHLPLPEDRAVLLFQSVRELLINVRKHAKTHRAVVTIEQIGGDLCLTVRDEGAGMDMTAAASVTPDTPTAVSSKFGLFSIRERMLAIGGRFEVYSKPGQGMTSRLVLPMAASGEWTVESGELARNEHVRTTDPSDTDRSSLTTAHSPQIRVLLVDDHAIVRQSVRELLQERPDIHIVGEAWDGEEAIAFVDKIHPDVVIMDVNMPKIDGIEATRRIKAAFKHVAIVGLSVNPSREVGEAMRMAGADAFLSKDAPGDSLYRMIVRHGRHVVPLARPDA